MPGFLLFFGIITVSAETISSYDIDIVVHADRSISVTEEITYDSEGLERHGIFRILSRKTAGGYVVPIRDITVTDELGEPIPTKTEKGRTETKLVIGDPNQTFVGEKVYRIQYTVDYVIDTYRENAELYWNIIGTEWEFPINAITAIFLSV